MRRRSWRAGHSFACRMMRGGCTRPTAVWSTEVAVEVVTDDGVFSAEHVLVAAGAWTNSILATLGITWPLTVTQEQVTYFSTPNLRDFASDRFPIWIWRAPEEFYGFPIYGEVATKAGQGIRGAGG